jgi:hypothetical protein
MAYITYVGGDLYWGMQAPCWGENDFPFIREMHKNFCNAASGMGAALGVYCCGRCGKIPFGFSRRCGRIVVGWARQPASTGLGFLWHLGKASAGLMHHAGLGVAQEEDHESVVF